MANVPNYAELKAKQAENMAMQNQMAQKANIAQETQQMADANRNRVLEEYMNPRQQGLAPQSNKQREASMLQAALQGQIDPRQVLADEMITPEAKEYLVGMLNQQMQPQQYAGLGRLG